MCVLFNMTLVNTSASIFISSAAPWTLRAHPAALARGHLLQTDEMICDSVISETHTSSVTQEHSGLLMHCSLGWFRGFPLLQLLLSCKDIQ